MRSHGYLLEATMVERHFDSVKQFTDLKPSGININRHTVRDDYFPEGCGHNLYSWFGTTGGITGVDEAVNHGWSEGEARARAIMSQINHDIAPAHSIKRHKRRGDYGDTIDIQKVYHGELDTAWDRMERAPIVGSSVKTIWTSITGAARRSSDDLFYKGVAAAILTDILENAGYGVEIIIYLHTQGTFHRSRETFYTDVVCKSPDEPFDFSRLITCTALAGFFRYHGFKAMLSEDQRCSSGLGYVIESPPEHLITEGDIILNNIYSERAAIRMITDVLSKFL